MELPVFTFGKGKHTSRDDGLCVMEAVALLANEPHSDEPKCADPVITKLAIWLNDSCGDVLRQELLLDLPWRIVGTKSTPEVEQQRAYMAADWAVRFVCPILLRRAGLESEAAKLEALPTVDSKSAADAAYAAADAYAARATADAYAAYAAADAYAARAADDAARAAVRAAYAVRAADAAYAAVRAAYAADAADAAVRAADAATYAADAAADDLERIQRSCAALLDRMIRLTEPQERVVSRRELAVA